MMSTLRRTLWGYSPKEVDHLLASLREDNQRLGEQSTRQMREIEELLSQLRQAKEEEELIRESIVDAKRVAAKVVQDAQKEADSMMSAAKQEIAQQFEAFKESIDALSEMRDYLIGQKGELERELRATVRRYADKLAETTRADSGVIEDILQSIEEGIEETEEMLKASKQVITLPRDLPSTGSFPFSKTAGALAVNAKEADLPVYSFL